MKYKNLIMLLVLGMFLITSASATIQTLGTFKQNECISLSQSCHDCSYINFTKTTYPDSSIALGNVQATKDGSMFNYTFCNTTQLGNYKVWGIGDVEATDTVFAYDFDVTPSGQSGNSNIVFFIFIILIIYAITFAGFFGKNIPITILGGMAMMFLGVYLISQGVIIFRDNITIYFSYLTIGLGVITTFWALLEQFDLL